MRMGKILGKVSLSPYTLQSKNYISLHCYREFRVYFTDQISPFFDWTETAEMTLNLQVDLVLSDTASTSEA